LVEPRLSSATRWYVTADPGEIDGLEFAYLSGAEGPQVESRSGWDVDGVEIRVILDFGAGFIDHRGWFMNAGTDGRRARRVGQHGQAGQHPSCRAIPHRGGGGGCRERRHERRRAPGRRGDGGGVG